MYGFKKVEGNVEYREILRGGLHVLRKIVAREAILPERMQTGHTCRRCGSGMQRLERCSSSCGEVCEEGRCVVFCPYVMGECRRCKVV